MTNVEPNEEQLSRVVTALESGRSMVVHGSAGIGKTWLAAAAAERLAGSWHVERLLGTPAVAQVAFSAVSHLLPSEAMPAPELLVASVLTQLTMQAGGGKLLLIVDDLDQLDVGSAAVVHQLQAQGGVVLATVRNGRADAPAVEAFTRRDSVLHIERHALTSLELGALIDRAVEGSVSVRLHSELWRLSSGNPFVALSVLDEARAHGELHLDDRGCWDADVTRIEFSDVEGHLGVRLGGLDEQAQRALDLVAIAEPMPIAWASRLGIDSSATQLEGLGLVKAELTAGSLHLSGAHPLISERVRSQQPPLRRRARVSELATCLADPDVDLDSPGLVRTALWALEGGVPLFGGASSAAVASAMSLFDLAAAGVLLDHTDVADRDLSMHIAAGKLAALTGDLATFEESFDRAVGRAETDMELAQAVIARSELQVYVLDAEASAIVALGAAFEEISDVAARAEVAAMLTVARGLAGEFSPGLEIAEEFLQDAVVSPSAELLLLIGNAYSQAMVGPSRDLSDRLDRAAELAVELAHINPVAEEQVDVLRSMVAMAEARMGDAIDAADLAAGRWNDAGRPSGAVAMSQVTMRAVAGCDDGIDSSGERGIALLNKVDPLGAQVTGIGVLAMAAACGGNFDRARDLVERGSSLPTANQARSAVWLARADNWILTSSDLQAAAEQSRDACERAVAHSHVVWGALAAHDAVRFGHPEFVADLLVELVEASNKSALVVLCSRHALASVDRSAEALELVAHDFAEAGCRSLAVSALVHACEAAAAGDNDARSAQLALMAHRAAGPVVGSLVPELARCAPPLSDRELSVGELVAAGMANRDVAKQLFISTRTVENHLGRVYSRLGISSRSELSELMIAPV